GTLYYSPNNNDSGQPFQVQNQIESAFNMRIINGVLYMLCHQGAGAAANNGLYNFVDINSTFTPLPYLAGAGNNVQVFTNLFLDFGTINGQPVANVLAFDMNPAGNIVYAADETFGIVKYVFSNGSWSQAYVIGPTNIGTLKQPTSAQGCFGI